jgi:hypothetical protein
MQGRAHAALGHSTEAAASFELAAEEAHRYGYFLWEVFALRDLKLLVLDDMGHSEHGSRRLGAALRQLKGPASMLSPMLKGLDAAELMALPPPDATLTVTNDASPAPAALPKVQTSDQVAARVEYEGLRVMALHARAVAEGVDDVAIEAAMEGDRPKTALVEMLLARHAAVAQANLNLASRRRELEAEKVMELHRRATGCAEIREGEVDDAMESDRPKAVLVALLLERERA